METRFPISKEREHVMLSFTWYDAFRASKRTEQHSIHFEKAAVMFNIGAVLTQQALACDRTQDQGMKDAAKKFQVRCIHIGASSRFCAAGMGYYCVVSSNDHLLLQRDSEPLL